MVSLDCGRQAVRFSEVLSAAPVPKTRPAGRAPQSSATEFFEKFSEFIWILLIIILIHDILRTTYNGNIASRKRQALFTIVDDNHSQPRKPHARRSTYIIHEPVEKASVLLLFFYSIPQPTLYHIPYQKASDIYTPYPTARGGALGFIVFRC